MYLAVAPEPSLGPRLQADLSAALAARIEAVIGPAWNVTVSPPPAALGEAMLHGLAELPGERVPLPSSELDKILLVAVTPIPGGVTVTARDFDLPARRRLARGLAAWSRRRSGRRTGTAAGTDASRQSAGQATPTNWNGSRFTRSTAGGSIASCMIA